MAHPVLVDAPPFNPRFVPGWAYGFDASYVNQIATTAFAGAGTVTVVTGTATFTSSQDGVIAAGDTVTINGNAYTVVSRTSGTVWVLTPANSEGAGSAFTVTKANPRVTQIGDLAGYVSGRNFAQATASAQPLWGLVDGQYAITTNGITTTLAGSAPVMTVLQNVPGVTCFVVVKATGAYVDIAAPFFVGTGTATGNARFVFAQVAAGSLWQVRTRRLDADSISTLNATVSSGTAWCVLAATVDYLTGAQRIYLNGALVGSNTASWTAGGNSSDTASLRASVGNANSANFVACALRAIHLWPRVVSGAEIAYLSRGLGQQYAIGVSA